MLRHKLFRALLFIGAVFVGAECCAQSEFALVEQVLPNPDNEPVPLHPLPTERQLAWHEVEFYAFFHYGLNTYIGAEWGTGGANPAFFAPTAPPDVWQWMETAKAARMKGGIAVVKHHDGFCLWPTSTTDYNCVVAGGNAYARAFNLPREFADAARTMGLKYGFYVSPWDRNNAGYGTRRYVDEVFWPQCLELASYDFEENLFELWLDGANGGEVLRRSQRISYNNYSVLRYP